VLTAIVTAYVATCDGCSGITASGAPAVASDRILAASRAWPLGSCVELLLPREGWVQFSIEDRGGAIDAPDRFDLLVDTQREAVAWGVQTIPYRTCRVIE
jgi:3D (Asp-Asp-Asp) domain-containing protein